MRYFKYLNEEDIVQKALGLPEPKIGNDYAPEKVERYISIIEDALNAMKKKEENDNNDAVVQDLRQKMKAWKEVDKETKPVKVKKEVPPDNQEEPPTQNQQQKESKLYRFMT